MSNFDNGSGKRIQDEEQECIPMHERNPNFKASIALGRRHYGAHFLIMADAWGRRMHRSLRNLETAAH
jgi:hypothetical protein